MNKVMTIAAAAGMFFGNGRGADPVYFSVDPSTGVQHYDLADIHCIRSSGAWFHCQPVGPARPDPSEPTQKPLFAAPANLPDQPHMAPETIARLAEVQQYVRVAAKSARLLRKSGDPQDLAALTTALNAATQSVGQMKLPVTNK